MKNPYDVLNVSENATDEEINRAYKALARKYHPDINPSQEAAQKMVEINCAYDEIKKMRANGQTYASYSRQSEAYNNYNSTHYSNSYSNDSYSINYDALYNQIASMLNMGYTFMVYQLLNSIPSNYRDHRWYYYASVFYYQSRNIAEAKQYIIRALQLNPNNRDYLAFKEQLDNMQVHERYVYRRGNSFTSIIWRIISVFIFIEIIQFIFMILFGGFYR